MSKWVGLALWRHCEESVPVASSAIGLCTQNISHPPKGVILEKHYFATWYVVYLYQYSVPQGMATLAARSRLGWPLGNGWAWLEQPNKVWLLTQKWPLPILWRFERQAISGYCPINHFPCSTKGRGSKQLFPDYHCGFDCNQFFDQLFKVKQRKAPPPFLIVDVVHQWKSTYS